MTIKSIKEIEENIDYLLETHDRAMMDKDNEMVKKIVEVINYELAKLEENEIKINSETLFN